MGLKYFFENISTLHRYSLELGQGAQMYSCTHCSESDQWVSHGFVYKKDYGGESIVVGKRVLCSNKGSRRGCGRTIRLYLASRIPRLHYSITTVFAFIRTMMRNSIEKSYQCTTGCRDARNAYRWIKRLMEHTSFHRTHALNQSKRMAHGLSNGSLISETFVDLLDVFGCGERYQIRTQEPFFIH